MLIRDRISGNGGSAGSSAGNSEKSGEVTSTGKVPSSDQVGGKNTWGRAWKVDLLSWLSCLFLVVVCPSMPFFFYDACTNHDCSLLQTSADWLSEGPPFRSFMTRITSSLWPALVLYSCWMGWQVFLAVMPDLVHKVVPRYSGGIQSGAVTPAGRVNKYRINGLQSWLLSHAFWFLNAFYLNWISPDLVFQLWGPLLVVANVTAYVLCAFVYVKGIYFPTHPDDCKKSGSVLYDYVMGVEFNPRIGELFDFKIFFNGRPGIVAWTLINLSFAWHQYVTIGYVTDSMTLLNVLQAVYVVDFFWNESWYLKTIDICHEHFGWMLGWGDLVWLPYMYTLQGFYLAHNPVDLGALNSAAIFCLGMTGYYIFRSCNAQKDRFRALKDDCLIWGAKPKYIECSFSSSDGKTHQSTLLHSGWWGVTRHMNYTGDLMGSLSYCLCCGSDHLLPYFYIIFISILLVHRIYRDEHRCKAKYGGYWDEYTRKVPYRLLPGVY